MSRAKRRERSKTRIGIYPLNRDEYGDFIAYCSKPAHRGVIQNERIKHCLEISCEHYQIFRPESRRYKR